MIDPLALREEFGTDAVRWYLLREMPTGGDASYTAERFLARYDELANVLGNLGSRVISMVWKYRDGVVPEALGNGLDTEITEAIRKATEAMAHYKVHEALAASMDLARIANGYVEDRQPWSQAKDPEASGDLDQTLATLTRALIVLCALFEPVTPAKMAEMALSLGLDGIPTLEESRSLELAGRQVSRGKPLFPRIEPSWAV